MARKSWVKHMQEEGHRHKSKSSTPGERRRAREEFERRKNKK